MPRPLPRIYFFADGPIRRGPFSLGEIQAYPLRAETLVWREGLRVWTPLRDVPELWAAFADRLVTPPPEVEAYRLPEEGSGVGMASSPAEGASTPVTAETPPGLAVTSVVLGAGSLPAWCLPGSIVVAAPLAVSAVVTGLLARGRAKAQHRPVHRLALMGLWLGVLNLAVSAAVLGMTVYFASTTRPTGDADAPGAGSPASLRPATEPAR